MPDSDRPEFRWTKTHTAITAVGVLIAAAVVLYASWRMFVAPFLGE
ncbi:MAG: hypothetical protein J0I06_21985 [Planctomycetes bacterium]|nr:hypothetical protein [Planctomycetota bacterium]